MTDKTLGQIAHDAQIKADGGCRMWEQMGDRQRAGWETTAATVVRVAREREAQRQLEPLKGSVAGAEREKNRAVLAERERLVQERNSLVGAVKSFIDAESESWAEFAAAAVASNCHSLPISVKGAAAVNAYQRLQATLLGMGPSV